MVNNDTFIKNHPHRDGLKKINSRKLIKSSILIGFYEIMADCSILNSINYSEMRIELCIAIAEFNNSNLTQIFFFTINKLILFRLYTHHFLKNNFW